VLVLTRKLMERLYIGDDICVTVVRLEGGQVRLGIDAPRDVAVVRAELVPERAHAHRLAHQRPAPPAFPAESQALRGRPPHRPPDQV
jgi:carbon storage regulator